MIMSVQCADYSGQLAHSENNSTSLLEIFHPYKNYYFPDSIAFKKYLD